jgi:hypothetical protein
MIVRELIQQLEELDPNAVVVLIQAKHRDASLRKIQDNGWLQWDQIEVLGKEAGNPRSFAVLAISKYE